MYIPSFPFLKYKWMSNETRYPTVKIFFMFLNTNVAIDLSAVCHQETFMCFLAISFSDTFTKNQEDQ